MSNKVSWLAVFGVAVLSWSMSAAEIDVKAHRDGYSFRDGKVVLLTGGRESFVTTEVTFNNGSRLLPDGIIVTREGRRDRFDNSRWLSTEGEYVVIDTNTASSDDFDGYYFEDGRVYVYRDRQPVLLTVDFTFGDGSRISPDGSFYTHDGSRSRMSEGQRVSKAGKAVEGKHTAANRNPANATTRTPAAPATATPATPANAATPVHPPTPSAPVDAGHKTVEPAKTREPSEHEKTSASAREKTLAPAHEKGEAPAPSTEKKPELR